ncbi:hypothetical protein NA57DRAFT_80679 [Rhizodiscina lignyota]|uniref:Uncharacterized protein n=1 Tax=Rhizodiscina lignyota TaxID=1504668 RepID=A0A9P4I7C9_9PEZI|nr:hypothetical protein NA57DRAFT_80679 [Rhizodiscina lignyota]
MGTDHDFSDDDSELSDLPSEYDTPAPHQGPKLGKSMTKQDQGHDATAPQLKRGGSGTFEDNELAGKRPRQNTDDTDTPLQRSKHALMSKVQRHRKTMDTMAKNLTSMEEALQNIERVESENVTLKAEGERLKAEKERLTSENEHLKAEKGLWTSEKAHLKADTELMKSSHEELERRKKENDSLRADNDALLNAFDEVVVLIKERDEDLDNFWAKLEELERQGDELHRLHQASLARVAALQDDRFRELDQLSRIRSILYYQD